MSEQTVTTRRIIICGGRDYKDYEAVTNSLNTLKRTYGIFTVIQGGASGADEYARVWAHAVGFPNETFRANWNKHGRAAGPIRNREMLKAGADLVVAFPGGKGTLDMVKAARKSGVRVWEPMSREKL